LQLPVTSLAQQLQLTLVSFYFWREHYTNWRGPSAAAVAACKGFKLPACTSWGRCGARSGTGSIGSGSSPSPTASPTRSCTDCGECGAGRRAKATGLRASLPAAGPGRGAAVFVRLTPWWRHPLVSARRCRRLRHHHKHVQPRKMTLILDLDETVVVGVVVGVGSRSGSQDGSRDR